MLRDEIDIVKTYAMTVVDKDIYFPSQKSAEEALALIGEDRLKKYYFCVEGTEDNLYAMCNLLL